MLGFTKNKRFDVKLGIEVSDTGLAIACVKENSPPEFFYFSLDEKRTLAKVLSDFVGQKKVQHSTCSVVLPIDRYQLMLVDKPAVAEEEMNQALKWKLKERLNNAPNDYVFQSFPLPSDAIRGGGDKVYAVVVKKDIVNAVVAAVKQAHLTLCHIDIAELAVRNVIDNLRSLTRGCAFLSLNGSAGSLYFYRGDNLYFSRDFEVVYSVNSKLDIDALSLEVQRSMDYYERQMAQPLPEKIICCIDDSEDNFIENLKKSFPIEFEEAMILNVGEKVENKSAKLNALAGILQ